MKRDVARHRVGMQQRADVREDRADVERGHRHLLAPEQGAHPVDHLAGALVVLANVLEDRADLVKVGRRVLHKQGRRLGVAKDRTERLLDLVGERRGELAHQ